MKNFSLLFNVILLGLIGVLFYLHFNPSSSKSTGKGVVISDSLAGKSLKIAYVDLDSIETNYVFYKEKMDEFDRKKENIDRDLNGTFQRIEGERMNMMKRGQAGTLTQAEAEAFQREYTNKMQNLEKEKQNKEMQMQKETLEAMDVLKKKVNAFLEVYNKDKGYTYIFSYGTGVNVLFYKDTTYNITKEVVDGLNVAYKLEKGAK